MTKFVLVLIVTLPVGLGAWWAHHVSASSSPSSCPERPVPVPWPLGDTGFETQRLYSSHGQFQDLDAYFTASVPPFVHSGIDIAACVDDVVYAIADGVVEYVSEGVVEGYNMVIVSDADDPDRGWSYLHLEDVYPEIGDDVVRDQALGTITAFPEYTGFDHLHLQRIEAYSGSFIGASDGGNPLLWLAARKDGLPPRQLPLGSPVPASVPFRFFEDGLESALKPFELTGEAVDIVTRVEDIFPGPGAPSCSTTTCATVDVAHQVVPMRLSFTIIETMEDPAGSGYPRTIGKKVFHNVIDLTLPVVNAEKLADYVYHANSKGDYVERTFYVDLTACQDDGVGSFTFEAGTEYLLQLVLEDASGNVSVHEMTVETP